MNNEEQLNTGGEVYPFYVYLEFDKNANFIGMRKGLFFHIDIVWRLLKFAFFVRQLRLSHFLFFWGGIMDNERKIGVVKKIDNLGRVVVPKEMRALYGFDKFVEVVQNEDGVLIRNPKYVLVEKEK